MLTFKKFSGILKLTTNEKITLKLINDIQFYDIEGRTFGEGLPSCNYSTMCIPICQIKY